MCDCLCPSSLIKAVTLKSDDTEFLQNFTNIWDLFNMIKRVKHHRQLLCSGSIRLPLKCLKFPQKILIQNIFPQIVAMSLVRFTPSAHSSSENYQIRREVLRNLAQSSLRCQPQLHLSSTSAPPS